MVNAKAPCPCGSGKRYKHCHGPADRVKRRRVVVLAGAVVALAAAAVIAWPAVKARLAPALSQRPGAPATSAPAAAPAAAVPTPATAAGDSGRQVLGERGADGLVRAPLPDPNPLTFRPPNSGELAPGEHPRPWEYDVAHNRYYDPRPGHMHWHSGEPPADTTQLGQAPVVVVTTPATSAPAKPARTPAKR